ncbi:hypothetical protein NMG60_11025905 [Bertholletia excelsa]
MPTLIFFILLAFGSLFLSSSAQIHHSRRILHHPLTPAVDSPPSATQSPFLSPQSQPKHPFSSLSPPNSGNPFFPFSKSPPVSPPPPTTSIATFPANISSLIVPQPPSKQISKRLVAVAVFLSLSAAILAGAAAFLVHRKHRSSVADDTSKTESLRLFPPNTTASDGFGGVPRRSRNVSNTSSEFLYLGILSGIEEDNQKATTSSNAGSSSVPQYQKLGSPELQPLPPLPRQQSFLEKNPNYEAGSGWVEDEAGEGEGEEEEFFSPRASSGSPPTGFDSSSSLTNSIPRSPFAPLDLSQRSFQPKSPASDVDYPQATAQSPPNQKLLSASPSSTPENRNSGQTQNSPVQIHHQSEAVRESDPGKFFPVKLPPPPPPRPPPRFWEMPFPPRGFNGGKMTEPPVHEKPEPGSENLETLERNEEAPRPKLKPLHWDKVRTSSDRAMVWDQLKSSSFQLNEEMIETLFMVNSSSSAPKDSTRRNISVMTNQENRVLDPRKSQNITILLRALNVTIDEVCEALSEGSADTLGSDLLEILLKMAPTKEEEWKLKEFKDESPLKLGPAEKFLKAVLDIPFAFQRVDAMLYIANFDSDIDYLKRSFDTLEAACVELRESRMFKKLLKAVLKTGNRMNDGTNRGDARAFKLDTLLRLADVKGSDGKTSLLHFVVHEISRAEGFRLAGVNQSLPDDKRQNLPLKDEIEFKKLGLQVVSSLSGELTNVKKAAAMDSDLLSDEVRKLAGELSKIGEVLKLNEQFALKESNEKFRESMNKFIEKAEVEITKLLAQEKVALCLVREITEYFHGDSGKEEAHKLRIFMVVRDFLSILDRVCKEVGKVNERTVVSSAHQFPTLVNSNPLPMSLAFNARLRNSFSNSESSFSP